MASEGPPDPVFVLRGCKSPVTSLLFTSPPTESDRAAQEVITSSRLVSGTQAGQINVWDLSIWRSVFTTDVHNGAAVLSLHERPGKDGVIFSQGRDGSFLEVDLNTQAISAQENLRAPALGFCPVSWAELNQSSVLVLPSDNRSQLDIFSMDQEKKISSLVPSGGPMAYGMSMSTKTMKLSSGAQYILVGYEDGSVSIWDLKTNKEVHHIKLHSESLMALDFHPSLMKGISGSADDMLKAWTVSDSQTIENVRDVTLTNPGVACVKFRNDGKFFVSGGWDGKIRAFGSKKCKPLAVLDHHRETVQCCVFSPDGLLAAGGKDQHISSWSLYR